MLTDSNDASYLVPRPTPAGVARERIGKYHTSRERGIPVKELKTVSMNFRVSPRFKRALRMAATAVNRTQTNFLETILFEYCDKQGITTCPASGSDSKDETFQK